MDRADPGNDEFCTGSTRTWVPPTSHLSPDDLRDIEDAVSRIEVHGARYPEHLQKMVGR